MVLRCWRFCWVVYCYFRILAYSVWLSPAEIESLIIPGQLNNFADITDHQEILPVADLLLEKKLSANAIPARPVQQALVNSIINQQLCSSGDCTRVSWSTVETLSALVLLNLALKILYFFYFADTQLVFIPSPPVAWL